LESHCSITNKKGTPQRDTFHKYFSLKNYLTGAGVPAGPLEGAVTGAVVGAGKVGAVVERSTFTSLSEA
jgi:hypothetical protein